MLVVLSVLADRRRRSRRRSRAPGARAEASPNAGKKVIVERVVAVVNDAIILDSELEARMVPVIGEAQQIADPKERERRIAKLRARCSTRWSTRS